MNVSLRVRSGAIVLLLLCAVAGCRALRAGGEVAPRVRSDGDVDIGPVARGYRPRAQGHLEPDCVGSVDPQARRELKGEVEDAEIQAEKSRRRALKLEGKLEIAQREAEAEGAVQANDADRAEDGEES